MSQDRATTQVGTGNRWEDVYAKLDPMKLAVIGGRNGDIGVGGLTLGGECRAGDSSARLQLLTRVLQVASLSSLVSMVGLVIMSKIMRCVIMLTKCKPHIV